MTYVLRVDSPSTEISKVLLFSFSRITSLISQVDVSFWIAVQRIVDGNNCFWSGYSTYAFWKVSYKISEPLFIRSKTLNRHEVNTTNRSKDITVPSVVSPCVFLYINSIILLSFASLFSNNNRTNFFFISQIWQYTSSNSLLHNPITGHSPVPTFTHNFLFFPPISFPDQINMENKCEINATVYPSQKSAGSSDRKSRHKSPSKIRYYKTRVQLRK